MMRRRLSLVPLVAAAALLPASAAHAAFFPSQPISGPSNDVLDVGDIVVSRAGDGGAIALLRDQGQPHAFVTRLVDGAFQPPERVDTPFATAASQPVIAGADNGRLIAAWVTAGQVLVSVRLADGQGFSAPQALGAGSDPAVDMSLNGAAYVTWTAPGGGTTDVRVARLPRGTATTNLDVLPDPLDFDPARAAGGGDGRSRVATSADGTAVAVWGEAGGDGRTHVIARRLFGERPSTSPQDVTSDSVDGHGAVGGADLPDIDIEDDSSFAWVTVRQTFDDGHAHIVARRLVGSAFETGTFVDGLGYPAAADAGEVVMQENGEGEGMAVSAGTGGVFSAVLHDNLFNPGVAVGSAGSPTSPSAGLGENGLGLIAWVGADGVAHARPYKYVEASRAVPTPQEEALLSDGQYGTVAAGLGLDMEVDRAGDAAAIFAQTGPDGTRLVGATFDRPPGAFSGLTTTKPRRSSQVTLSWGPSFELWGDVTYQPFLDGQPVGSPTTGTSAAVTVADGRHPWYVLATDARGQQTATKTRDITVDKTPPSVTFKVSKVKGGLVKVSATARDGVGGSGIARVRIDFGDGTAVNATTATHRYGSKGKKSVRVSATDKAGNAKALTRRITA